MCYNPDKDEFLTIQFVKLQKTVRLNSSALPSIISLYTSYSYDELSKHLSVNHMNGRFYFCFDTLYELRKDVEAYRKVYNGNVPVNLMFVPLDITSKYNKVQSVKPRFIDAVQI